tara:strand:- start:167 stop:571 length:405 start_codon:yes stop_codon:yes gene_type:complete
MSECIFCKILKGKIPCHKVYEDDKVLAFLDIHPATRGHTLVIPKKHYKDINDFPGEEFGEFMKSVQKVAKVLKERSGALKIIQNNGTRAGQVVLHVHFHLIPIAEDEELNLTWNSMTEEMDIEKVQEDIKKLLK